MVAYSWNFIGMRYIDSFDDNKEEAFIARHAWLLLSCPALIGVIRLSLIYWVMQFETPQYVLMQKPGHSAEDAIKKIIIKIYDENSVDRVAKVMIQEFKVQTHQN